MIHMRVDHELCQRTVHPCDSAFQHDEPRTGGLGRGLEIHQGCDTGDLKMLFRDKIKAGHIAPAVYLEVVIFISAIRNIVGRQVGNPGKHVIQLRVQILGLCLHGGDFGFLVADQGAQPFEFGLVALGPGCADQFRRLILLGLRRFGRRNLGAPRFVQRQYPSRHRRIPAPRQCGVKSIGVFADGFDVVHGAVPSGFRVARFAFAALCPIVAQGARCGVAHDYCVQARFFIISRLFAGDGGVWDGG